MLAAPEEEPETGGGEDGEALEVPHTDLEAGMAAPTVVAAEAISANFGFLFTDSFFLFLFFLSI
jgi:hypothetical protein